MASTSSGTVSARPTRKRSRMDCSSGSGGSSASTVRGSSAMPHLGQLPGPFFTTSGCMGHTYSTRDSWTGSVSGSSAMPHLGQAPGCDWRTSGSMGQTYRVPGAGVGSGAVSAGER